MGTLLRLLAFVFLFYLVRFIIRALFSPAHPYSRQPPVGGQQTPAHEPPAQKIKQGKMEKDPVCGTYVDVATSLHLSARGETKFFCSAECLDQYRRGR